MFLRRKVIFHLLCHIMSICRKATSIYVAIEHAHTTALCYFISVPFLSLLFSKMSLEISDISMDEFR